MTEPQLKPRVLVIGYNPYRVPGPWECVVIGGGVRRSEEQLDLFERVINLVRQHALDAAIAFNATPSDTYEAAARWDRLKEITCPSLTSTAIR